MQWRVSARRQCRFLVFGHLALGEHEFASRGRVEIDARNSSSSFGPTPKIVGGGSTRTPSITW